MARCALGALHVRLATLWPETIKLLAALTLMKQEQGGHVPAWDALFLEVEELQGACLDTHDAAAAAAAADDGGGKHKKKFGRRSFGGGGGGDASPEVSEAAAVLSKRMSAGVNPVEAGTEKWKRLELLLRAVTASSQVGLYTLQSS
jgi:hypothetical protein